MRLPKARWKDLAAYVVAVAGSLGAAVFALGLKGADLRIPFAYDSDALATSAQVKNLIETGTLATNPMLGMPGGASFADFPGSDGIHVVMLRVLSSLTGDYALAVNAFFLLGFVLVAIASVAVLRALGASRTSSVALAIVYAALPYHFWRGEGHLFLSAYWMVPLAVLVCMWLATGTPLLFGEKGWRLALREPRTLAALAICLVLGVSGVYYAFFSAFLLLAATVFALVRAWDPRRLVAGTVLVLALCLTFGASLVPSWRHTAEEGVNAEVAQRWDGESEVYALRLPQMLLPVTNHRLMPFAEVKSEYREILSVLFPAGDNENDYATLGLLLSAGFLGLIGVAVWPGDRWGDVRLRALASLNLASFLLGTIAGFSVLFALLVTPQLRAYNRISVFIAFLCAAFVALVLDRFRGRTRLASLSFAAACALLVACAVFDQSSYSLVIDQAELRSKFDGDARFVQQVEESLPVDGMVFQLPYMSYPESPPVEDLTDYEHLRAYLHSEHTRWSYGAMKGRETDLWQRAVVDQPTAEFLDDIVAEGFDGVWIDTRGYPDKAVVLVGEVRMFAGVAPLTSEDGRIVYFPLPAE